MSWQGFSLLVISSCLNRPFRDSDLMNLEYTWAVEVFKHLPENVSSALQTEHHYLILVLLGGDNNSSTQRNICFSYVIWKIFFHHSLRRIFLCIDLFVYIYICFIFTKWYMDIQLFRLRWKGAAVDGEYLIP